MKLNFAPISIADYSPDPTLTEQQHRIIARLACGWSINSAAKSEKLHRNTVGYWRRTIPAFARELEFASREQRRYWQDEAVQLAGDAMQAIRECITDPKSSPSVRFRAATFIIKMATDSDQKARKAFSPLPAELEAIDGQTQGWRKEAQTSAPVEPATAAPDAEGDFDTVQTAQIEKTAQSAQSPIRVTPQPGRNTVCPCGSGIKFKRCCLNKPPLEAKAAA